MQILGSYIKGKKVCGCLQAYRLQSKYTVSILEI